MQFADAIFRCSLIEVGRRFLPVFTDAFGHNAAQTARSHPNGAFPLSSSWKKKTNEKRGRGLNQQQQQLVRSRDRRLTDCAMGWSKHPTRCACVKWVDFQIPGFCLWCDSNISIMCTSRDCQGKTIETFHSFLKFLRTKKCANHLQSVIQRRSITFVPVEWC